MDIQIIKHIKEKLQVVINCRQVDDKNYAVKISH